MDLYSNINFRLRTEEPWQIVISLKSTKIMSWLETYVENWATFKILDVDTPPQTVFDVRFKAKPRAVLSGLSKMDFMITLFVSNPSSRNNFS